MQSSPTFIFGGGAWLRLWPLSHKETTLHWNWSLFHPKLCTIYTIKTKNNNSVAVTLFKVKQASLLLALSSSISLSLSPQMLFKKTKKNRKPSKLNNFCSNRTYSWEISKLHPKLGKTFSIVKIPKVLKLSLCFESKKVDFFLFHVKQ